MANTIKHKRGTTTPTAGQLVIGELAINTTTGGVFTKTDAGAVVAVGLDVAANWGNINGTLSNQTDLQGELNLKAPLIAPSFTSGITVDATGITFSDSTIQTTAGIPADGNVTLSNSTLQFTDGSITTTISYQDGILLENASSNTTINPSAISITTTGDSLGLEANMISCSGGGASFSLTPAQLFMTNGANEIFVTADGLQNVVSIMFGDGSTQTTAYSGGAYLPTVGGSMETNAFIGFSGSNTRLARTGITFPDATVQTTATLVGPAGPAGANGANGANGAVWNYRGAYDNGLTYYANDYVDLNGSSYVMINTVGAGGYGPISHPATWQLVAHKGDTGATGAAGNDGATGATGNNGTDGSNGGIPEAPYDGQTYGRNNNNWTVFSTPQIYSENILTNVVSVYHTAYYITSTDSNKIFTITGPCSIYLDSGSPIGTQLVFTQTDSNNSTFYGYNGGSVRAKDSKYRTNGEYSVCTAIKTDSTTWYLAGDIIV